MTENFDESNLLDYQGYIRDEIIDFEEKNIQDHDESIDDESSEVGWNNEDEKKYYSKNNSELNETCIIHEEMDEELKNDEMDEELNNEEMDEEVVVEEKQEEEQHAWYYGLKEEPNHVYESFIPEEKPLVQEEINNQETKLPDKKCFWGIIWDFINIFSK